MKLRLIVAALFLTFWVFIPLAYAQKVTCGCNSPDNSCHGTVTCSTGCTAVCGSKDRCYMSCRSDPLVERINAKFVEKSGVAIAAELTDLMKKKIEFIPFKHGRKKAPLYNLEVKNDNVWFLLEKLSKDGTVKVGGETFENFRKLRNETTNQKLTSLTFTQIPAKEVAAMLTFFSGHSLTVQSGDPDKLISISLQGVTLSQILDHISSTAGVQIK
jgi:hypothetical protein